MAHVSLPCVLGDICTYATPELEYEQADSQLERHMKYAHPTPTADPGGNNTKPEKFPRPTIDMESTTESWEEFIPVWSQYKEEYKLSGKPLIRQLYACCSQELKTSLSRILSGKQFDQSETQLLESMKQLAVRHQNPAVHVQEFLGLSQQPDKSIRHYLTRLRGIGSRCNFSLKCEDCDKELSYQDNMIRFKLIAGLSDSEIKEHILSEEDKTLEQTVKMVEAKECGKLARKTVGMPVNNTGKVQGVETVSTHRPCKFCGRSGHGSDRPTREKFCPAFGKICHNCGKTDHFGKVCLSKKLGKHDIKEITDEASNSKISTYTEADLFQISDSKLTDKLDLGSVAGLLYSINKVSKEIQAMGKIKVPHMLHEQLNWVTRSPPEHPTCMLTVETSPDSYRSNGFTPPSAYKRRSTNLESMADTGCQACCMGRRQMQALGLSESDLITPTLNLKAANSTGITILGCVFVYISGVDSRDRVWGTHQLCYISEGIDQLLLSRQACEQLGMITTSFPAVGSAQPQDSHSIGAISNTDLEEILNGSEEEFQLTPCNPKDDGSCDCPRRESTPPPPQFQEGMSVSEAKSVILEHYASSAFNRCTRQKLPLMKGEPLPIPTRTDARPFAVHQHIPIPLHFRDRVWH